MGVIIDGCPSNLDVDENHLQKEVWKRSPGRVAGTSARKEPDEVEILSGIFEGKTLGTPICVIVRNQNQKSSDYVGFDKVYRPGHADKTTELKYKIRDYRGGGRASGRETISRVIAGYFAGLILTKTETQVISYVSSLGKIQLPKDISYEDLFNFIPQGDYHFPLVEDEHKIKNYLHDLKVSGDSVGGEITTVIKRPPKGLGEPVFHKLKSDLSSALLSIGACVSFEFGLGKDFLTLTGKHMTDRPDYFGGLEGGISNGHTILVKCVFKPTSTVGEKAQQGRHDPCIVPRAIPVVNAMIKIVMADHFLRQRAYE